MNTLKIRGMLADDLIIIQEIAIKGWTPIQEHHLSELGEVYSPYYQDWKNRKRNELSIAFQNIGNNRQVFIAEFEGTLVGFIDVYHTSETKAGELGNNAVDPDYQGKGIATSLYNHAISYLKDNGIKSVKVQTGLGSAYAPARRGYEKLGFTKQLPSVTYYMEITEN